ncbi:hypothetical protein KSF_077160 [Reticulibacter mediterranei]|uniref:Anaphase-promoting complex subunit 4-like WD40 domain-containing protein n=1 Tax=Reticulibacter mediterranei TaxID=2778369 RepID=A0A8J3IP99_9CHLR|nr:hypothetical protein [Reticulibacter mediterranei]GHO97668.1 hypothetical protein KSF_077160 [Reticulibacter mediterranei]
MAQQPEEAFTPDTIDERIDQLASLRSQAWTSPDAQVVQRLSILCEEDQRSTERIWQQLRQHVNVSNEGESDVVDRETTSVRKERRNIMEENHSSWEMHPLTPIKKRPSPMRLVGIGLIAAVVIITIVSFTVFSGALRSASQTATNRSTLTGSQNHPQQQTQQQQKVISSGKQVCSLNAGEKVSTNGAPWSADLDWSVQGHLVVGTYSSFKAYSAKDCSPITSFQPAIQQQPIAPLWSPDGKKLLLADPGDLNSTYVLDSNGKIVTKLKGDLINTGRWSSDSAKIVFSVDDTQNYPTNNVPSGPQPQTFKMDIKAVDVGSGKITTLTQLPQGYTPIAWSSDVKTVVVRHLTSDKETMDLATWNSNQGKLVSHTTLPAPQFDQQLSPDGSLLALDSEDKIEIYSTNNWSLLASFANNVAGMGLHKLAWSPDGKYLAGSANAIKIYDMTSRKLATTFGQVDDQRTITTLAWSPDGTGIATSSMVQSNDQPSDLTINVWALS